MTSFANALNELLAGRCMRRAGWNGKGMYVFLVPAHEWAVASSLLREPLAQHPWIAMRTADAKLVPWLASQTDMLAQDWEPAFAAAPAPQVLAPQGFTDEAVHVQ